MQAHDITPPAPSHVPYLAYISACALNWSSSALYVELVAAAAPPALSPKLFRAEELYGQLSALRDTPVMLPDEQDPSMLRHA